MFVTHRFELDYKTQDYLQSLIPRFGYNGFGELVFHRTYSRIKKDGGQENWADCITRVVNGTFSIRKDFYIKNHIPWNNDYWQSYARNFAISMYNMEWLPPGRGLWAMGSDFVYERGSMALQNCGFTLLSAKSFASDLGWLMDSLMHGVGVGFNPVRDNLEFMEPKNGRYDNIIPDTREGWVDSVEKIIKAYMWKNQKPYQIYDQVRPAGLPIKGFGGISSGPEPLKELHNLIEEQCELFLQNELDVVEFKTNCANMVGCCVVSGNVRRSAEIACGSINDEIFLNLKDYKLNQHRAAYAWMSNNSAILESDSDFDLLGEIAKRVLINGEPGLINLQNIKYGRIGKKNNGLRRDEAIGFNPCGEQPLCDKEICCLVETLPTMCRSNDDWYKALEYATFYASTVTLLPTHQPETNKVICRNRRIGVGIIDVSGWKHVNGVHKITRWLRSGYNIVRETNKQLNAEAGIPEAIRVTTIKPGGTVPKLPGKTSGIGHPTFRYTLRRIRVQQNTSFHEILVKAGIPYEKDYYSANTDVFEYPILQGPAKTSEHVSLWEQANNLVLMQREWSDNAVSNTLYFRPKWKLIELVKEKTAEKLEHYIGYNTFCNLLKEKENTYIVKNQYKFELNYNGPIISEVKIYEYDPRHEEDDVESVLSSIAPLIKSVSLLPHTPEGVYPQMPEEGISKEEYERRLGDINIIDWSDFNGSDGQDERYCTAESCEVSR